MKNCLREVLTHARNLGHSVTEFLSDGGKEFDNSDVKAVLSDFGVVQRITAPYTPQQNGRAERENRTVVEMARTFKYSNPDVVFPDAIWAELVMAAVYVLNRTAKSSEADVSPYECWTGSSPRLKHLRIISSTCYLHVPEAKRKKMDRKAKKGFLVGYDGDERYRIYVPEDRDVCVSRDVKFQEILKSCRGKVNLPLADDPSPQPEKASQNLTNIEPRNVDPDEAAGDSEDSLRTIHETSDSECDSEIDNVHRTRSRTGTTIKQPGYLRDFVCFIESDTPETYEQAIASKDKEEWLNAMKREMNSLIENRTWKLSQLPKGRKALPCKWVYRVKTNSDGSIDRYKARLVVKGFNQRKGIDYTQTFSPVTRMATIRSLLSVATEDNLKLIQFDVSTAFLYGDLEEDIYMAQPKGFEEESGAVCKLKKSLYGLKQAPRCWNKRFGDFLAKEGFRASCADPCLFVRIRNERKTILAIYVDDGLIASSCEHELDEFMHSLEEEFKITSKEADYYLGLEIEKSHECIKISQKEYAKRLLRRFGFDNCKPISTPILKGTDDVNSKVPDSSDFPYRQVVGSLMYLMIGSRPDIAYSVGVLSRNLEKPTVQDVTRAKRVLRYVKGTVNYGITYRRNRDLVLQCFSDADYGGCEVTKRSTSGVLIKYAGGAISWLSNRQGSVALSTTEAEIIAASEACKEIVWVNGVYHSLTGKLNVPTLNIDNAAAVKLAENPEMHRRTKHIERRHFYVRELVSDGKIKIKQIASEFQLADIMTKPLAQVRLRVLNEKMGLQ